MLLAKCALKRDCSCHKGAGQSSDWDPKTSGSLHSHMCSLWSEQLCVHHHLLQESLAQYVILLDDDVQPLPHCVPSYVQAMLDPKNKQVGGGGEM